MLGSLAIRSVAPTAWRAAAIVTGSGVAAIVAGLTWSVALTVPLVAGVCWLALDRTLAARASADIARRERLEHALDLQRTREALVGAGVGTWIWDLTMRNVVYDAACSTMLGYGDAEIDSTLGSWGKLLHPDDAATARRGIDELCRGATGRYEARVRLRAADGSWRTILDRGTVVARDAGGRATRLAGVHIDVTEPGTTISAVADAERWVVVDDDPSVRMVIERVLSRSGIAVSTFADPHAALAAILASPPVGIVTDFDMPGMSGLELAKRVRDAGHDCAVVLVTGSDAAAIGDCSVADRVLSKPFAVHDLIAAVDRRSPHASAAAMPAGAP